MKVLGISGTLVGSKTSILVNSLLEQLKHNLPDIEVELLDMKNYQLDFCDGRPTTEYSYDTQAVIQKITQADAFIIGTTFLHGSMPGVLKNLFELVPIPSFTNKCVVFAANGGNQLHFLAIENYVKPVANYLRMFVLPDYAFALSSDFTQQNELKEEKKNEINQIIERYTDFLTKLAHR